MNTTKYSATVRELGDMAESMNMTVLRLLEVLGPIPMPPAGYVLAPKSETRWIGTETMARGYIITPSWDYRTQKHSIELWTSKDPGESDAHLTPADAVQLAADLTAAAEALPGGKN